MQTISSYRGYRPTNKQTHTHTNPHTNRQDRLQHTASLSLARSEKILAADIRIAAENGAALIPKLLLLLQLPLALLAVMVACGQS